MKLLRYPALLLAFALTVTPGCGRDDPAGPEIREGTARFDYTGDQGGAYEAVGEFRLLDANTLQAGSWAVAGRGAAGELTVLGFSSPTGSRGTLLILPLGSVTQGGTVSLECTGTGCPRAGVIFNAVALGSRTATETLYGFTQGTVTVDTLTQTRIAGSFSGRASFYDLNFVPNPTRTLTVINGRFGVPIRDNL
jgi:hypothetical protein